MKHILFDFDGTLMNTWPGIEATLRASLEALDLPVQDDCITRALVGIPLLRVFEELLAGEPAKAVPAVQKYRELFPITGMAGARPYDGTRRMLEKLVKEDRQIFLVTARNEMIAKQMMEDHDLTRFFSGVRGEQEGEVPDSKNHMVAEVLQGFGLAREECVMVGDRRYDIEAAVANSIKAIGVTYGYGTREELQGAGAGILVDTIGELEEMLSND